MPIKDLPTEYQTHEILKTFETPKDLADSYIELKKWQSGAMALPKNPEDVEGWQKAYDRLGHPKEAKDYEDVIPAGDDPFIKKQQEIFAKHRVPKKAAEEFINTARQQAAEMLKAKNEALIKEWGTDFEKNRGLAERGLQKMKPEERELYDTLSKYDPQAASRFALRTYKANADDNPGAFHLEPAMTASQALSDLRKLKADAMGRNPDPVILQRFNDLSMFYVKNGGDLSAI